MRSRDEIERDGKRADLLQLEVLLDIRTELVKLNKQTEVHNKQRSK